MLAGVGVFEWSRVLDVSSSILGLCEGLVGDAR